MIQLINISKSYATSDIVTLAVRELNLSIEEGELTAIMGPSGCGKSTLLNVIGMLDKPDSGSYVFRGKDLQHASQKELAEVRKNNVGFVFQNFNLIEELTVFENVALPLLYQKVSKSESRERVMQILEQLSIEHRSKHFPTQLSGGQQQRVAIARALVNRPGLILADEPTGNLDSRNGEEVLNVLMELNAAGTTVVMVTHSEHDASHCRRIVRLLDGQVEKDVRNTVVL